MKKILGIFSIITLLVFSSLSSHAFTFEIGFGAPTVDGCVGFGLCYIKSEFKAVPEDGAIADINVTNNGKLKFIFTRQSMTPQTIVNFFSNGTFRIDADYTTTPAVMQALKLTTPYVIKKGVYKVVRNYTNNTFELVL